MNDAELIEQYVAHSECGECGYDGELIVEMGGGFVSVTCPSCDFAASAPASDIGPEWDAFCAKVDTEDALRRVAVRGGALGYLMSAALFVAALIFGGVLEQ